MTPQRVTQVFIVADFALVVAFDVTMWWFYGRRATISWILSEWGSKYTAFPCIVGGSMLGLWMHFFCDHWFKRPHP